MRRRFVTVNDRMQQGYRDELTAPAGRDFAPEFRPTSRQSRCLNSACSAASISPIAATSFRRAGLRERSYQSSGRDCSLNYFGVARLSRTFN
jgi:hypothetical protein